MTSGSGLDSIFRDRSNPHSPGMLRFRPTVSGSYHSDPDRVDPPEHLFRGMNAWIETYKLADGTEHHRVRQQTGSKKSGITTGISKTLAENKKTLIEADKIHGRVGIVNPKKTVGQHVENYLDSSRLTKATNTYQMEKHSLRPFVEAFSNRFIVALTKSDIEGFMLGLLRTRKVNGVKIIMRIVHSCLEKVGLPENPSDGVDNLQDVSVARVITDDEMGRLLNASTQKEFKEIMLIARNTGMRRGEILALDADKHFYGDCIRIERHQMKNRRVSSPRPKIVPLTKPIAFLKGRKGLIYKDWSADRIENHLWECTRKAGIKGRLRFHDFKHTFCSNWKGDISTLAEITGNSWKTLQKYVHPDEDKLRTAMERSSFPWGRDGGKPSKSGQKAR